MPTQPSRMSFGVSDGAGFEYNGASPNGLFASRRHIVSRSFYGMVAELIRFNRDARELLHSGENVSLRDWLARLRYSPAFIDRLIVPQASAVWSADPGPDVVLSGALHGRVLREPWHAGLPGSPALADRDGRFALLRGGAHLAVLRAHPAGCPVADIDRDDVASASQHVVGRPSGSTRSCWRRTQIRRLRCSRTRAIASVTCSARSRTSQTRPCFTPTVRCCRGAGGRGRAGTTTWTRSRAERAP